MTASGQKQHMTLTIESDVQAFLTNVIKQATATYLGNERLDYDVDQLPLELRLSAQATFGDYSFPLMAWSAKNRVGRPPLAIAEALAGILQGMRVASIAEVTATKPGYLNIRLNRPIAGRAIMERVLGAGSAYGTASTGAGTKVVVEHTNINSNKAAHVGHLRNACLGDTVVRMLRSQGHEVEAQNYIDDTGVQVADVVVAFTLLDKGILDLPDGAAQLPGESFDYYCSRLYVAMGKAYDAHPELLDLRKAALLAIEHGGPPSSGPDYAPMAADLSKRIVQAHLNTMARLNVDYNLLTWESVILRAGLWRRTFQMLRESGILQKPETGKLAGCWVLPFGDTQVAGSEEDEHTADKILVKSDGTATYTGKDIAYQLWKFGLADDPRVGVQFHFILWGIQHDGSPLWTMLAPQDVADSHEQADPKRFGHAQRVINVIDVRQSYPQQVVYESLRRLGYPEQAANSTHLAYEVVTLSARTAASLGIDTSDGHQFYAMSGRKGIEIKADDLINAAVAKLREGKPDLSPETAAILAAAAIRYFMVRIDLNQIIALDVDEVLRASGDTGIYLQYAHARARSILRRLQEANTTPARNLKVLPSTLEQSEWELLLHLDAYPRVLAEAAAQLAPHILAGYAFELATRFTSFYEHTPPILREEDRRVKAFRARLVQATAQTLENALKVLGFVPLDRI